MFSSNDIFPISSIILHQYSGGNACTMSLQSQVSSAHPNDGEWTSQHTHKNIKISSLGPSGIPEKGWPKSKEKAEWIRSSVLQSTGISIHHPALLSKAYPIKNGCFRMPLKALDDLPTTSSLLTSDRVNHRLIHVLANALFSTCDIILMISIAYISKIQPH